MDPVWPGRKVPAGELELTARPPPDRVLSAARGQVPGVLRGTSVQLLLFHHQCTLEHEGVVGLSVGSGTLRRPTFCIMFKCVSRWVARLPTCATLIVL